MTKAALPGSESMACIEGIFVNVGDPHNPPRMEYPPTSLKTRGGRDGNEEVSGVVVPMKRVTTAEGRTPGNSTLGRET